MLSEGDSSEVRDSPIPKPRPRLRPLDLEGVTDDLADTEVTEGASKKKKKSSLTRLKDRKRNAVAPSEDTTVSQRLPVLDISELDEPQEQEVNSSILNGGVEQVVDAEDQVHTEIPDAGEVPFYTEDSPPLSSRKKKKKGALSRLKEKQTNLNGSLSSLRSAEMPDLKALGDMDSLTAPKPTILIDASEAKASSSVSGLSEDAKELDQTNQVPALSIPTEEISGEKVAAKPNLPSENSSFKPVAPAQRFLDRIDMNDVIETDEDSEDKEDMAANYEKLLLSPGRSGKPAFPSPKPSSNVINRSNTVKSSQMVKSDSMPNINESIRSSKRNWELIRSKVGLEAEDASADETMRRSASALSISSAVSSGLHTVRVSTARHKNFLVGQKHTHSSVMGASELDRTFPDRNINVFVGTWNMAEFKRLDEPIEDFLLPKQIEYVPDILVITSQENELDRREWEVSIQETIGPTHVMYHSALHGTLHLAICMKRELIWFCSVPESDNVTVRAFKQFRTKGAVAISFTMFGTSFLFIGSHFKSDEGNEKARIQDYLTINKTIKLPRAVVDNPLQRPPPLAALRFDAVFWAGDLNFRINKDRDMVLKMIRSAQSNEHPNYELLLDHEELTQAMSNGEIFEDFQEGQINFPPTYKFDPGTDVYETSAKCRIPSYTDRILFRAKRKHSVVCKKYCSAPELKSSDHKPVYGLYQVNLKPGRDTIPLSGGQFRREVYVEAAKRRALRRVANNLKVPSQGTSKSAICCIS